MSHRKIEHDSDILEEDDTTTRTPRPYNVLLLNDDYTTMDFVQEVLMKVFHHTPSAAAQLMLQVHTQGQAVAGTYTRDIAETKAQEAIFLAREQGHPLRCSIQPA